MKFKMNEYRETKTEKQRIQIQIKHGSGYSFWHPSFCFFYNTKYNVQTEIIFFKADGICHQG